MKKFVSIVLALIVSLSGVWAQTNRVVSNPVQVTDLGTLSSNDYYVLQNSGSSLYNYYDADNGQMDAKDSYDYSSVVRLLTDGTNVKIQQVSTGTYYQGLEANARLALGEEAVNYTFNTAGVEENCFRFANGACYLNRFGGGTQYPMGAATSFAGAFSQWNIYKVDYLEYDAVCTLVDGTQDPTTELNTKNGNVLTSTNATGIAGLTLTAGVFDRANWLSSRCLAIKTAAAQTPEKVIINAPAGYTIVGYEIECFSVSTAYCPYLIDTNEEYTGVSLGGAKTTFTVKGLDTNSTYFWLYANAATVANWVGVSSFKVYLKQSEIMPSDGKVYNINFVSLDQNTKWGFSLDGINASALENEAGSEFVAHKYTNANGEDRYIFVNNADGYYLAYHTANQYFNADHPINEFSVNMLADYADNNITANDAQKADKLYILNDKRDVSYNGVGCFILEESNATFNRTMSPFYNGRYTSALTFEKVDADVSAPAALAVKRFDAIYAAKPYRDNIGSALGTYSVSLNGEAYSSFEDYMNAVNNATEIESYSVVANEPTEGKVYKISSRQYDGSLYQIANNEAVINPADTVIENNYGYWVCHKNGNNYTFSSAAGDGTYFGWQGLSTTAYNFNLLTNAVNEGCYSFYSASETGGGRYLYVHNDFRWNRNSVPAFAAGGSTDFLLEEVDASVYTANISGTPDGQLTYTGEGYIGSASVLNGGTWVLNNSVTVDDFTAANVSGYTKSDITLEDNIVSVTYTFNTDEIFSESFDNAKWIRLSNCSNSDYAMYATAESEVMGTQAKNLTAEGQLIAFVGNAENFKIYSRVKGADYALTADDTNEGTTAAWTASDEAAAWKLVSDFSNLNDNPGFGITLADNGNNSLNMWGGAGGNCRFYPITAGNKGSRWVYEIITNETAVSYTLDNPTRYPETNYIWGQVTYTVNGANTITSTDVNITEQKTANLYLTDGYSVSKISAEAYHGYDVRVEGNNVFFTGNDEEYQYLAYTPKDNHPYRIPAIAKAKNGNLVAIFDYRPCNLDVGYGEVDEVMRLSKDNGRTWSEIQTIADGDGSLNANVFGLAYGDPALAADRESNKMVLITVSGKVVYTGATAENRPFIARLISEDGGETWSDPEDITSQFWGETGAIFQNGDEEASASVFAYSGFFGSGKILQGSFRAEGAEYNRLYAAMLVRGKGLQGAYVVYSDDFGTTWKLLGGDASLKALSQSDEPKVEELPNGSIILSGRLNGGRCFNIFTYTDKQTATGTWSTGGNLALGINNSTNGEVLIVDAKKAEDMSPAKLLLLSVPMGPNRANIGVYYKDITAETDYDEVADFTNADNWRFGHQVSYGDAAYSTMCVQQDGRIGLLYEGTPTSNGGYGYSITYFNTNIEQLTAGAYTTPSKLEATYDETTGLVNVAGVACNEDDIVAAISQATGEATVTSVDLTDTYLYTEFAEVQSAISNMENVSKNTIYYISNLNQVPEQVNNVVVDGQCQNLVLTDAADFAPAAEFTAANALYTKGNLDANRWYSCVLPYAISTQQNMRIVNDAHIEGSTIIFVEVEEAVEPNTPFLYKTEDTEVTFAANDVLITPTMPLESGELRGTYRLIDAPDAQGKLILNTEGLGFVFATNTDIIPAFNAYIGAQESEEDLFTIYIEGDMTGVSSIDADGNLSQELVNVYSVDGRLLRSNVNTLTALEGLARGVYIINGRKVKK